MAHHGQIVRDEQVRELELALQVFEQIDDLRLDRNVERRYRFIAHDEGRLHRQRTRYSDALALAAGELVRIALDHVVEQTDLRQQFGAAGRARVEREFSVDELVKGTLMVYTERLGRRAYSS